MCRYSRTTVKRLGTVSLSVMSVVTPSDDSTESYTMGWNVLLIAGALFMLFGLFAVIFPFITGISISLLFGALIIAGGIVHLVNAVRIPGWKATSWNILLGVVFVLGGVALVTQPIIGLVTLTLLLAGFFIAEGVVSIAMALRFRGENGWTPMLVNGVFSLLLAGIILAGFPGSAVWALGIIVGVDLLMTGVSLLALRSQARSTASTETPPDDGVTRPSV